MHDISAHFTRCTSRSGATASRVGHRLSRLTDEALLRRLARLVARDRATTALLLAHIAEVDARRLYAPAGYPSMHAYCVGELRLSEDASWKRIQAARAARRVPALLEALAHGRLHLSGVCLLAPHITEENASKLIEAATHRTKAEVELLLLRRIAPSAPLRLAPGQVGDDNLGVAELAPGQVGSDNLEVVEHALAHVGDPPGEPATRSPERVSLHVAIPTSTREKLRYAQALLSHAVPSGDPALVLDRALDALIEKLEKRRFGAQAGVSRRERAARTLGAARATHGMEALREPGAPCVGATPSTVARSRYIPAHVRRAVWERDQGRCTFVGSNGHRCDTRRFLEFDHVEPVARGGRATVEGLRLRCRTHNQYEAERALGVGFMENKRREAREARGADVRAAEKVRDIQAGLRRLGCRVEEARRTAEQAVAMLPTAPLEEQLRAALQSIGQRAITTTAPASPPTVGVAVRST